jgi:2-oxoglutarate dehydrogenase E2 component (dihydrolipoamide succinyltransferase)
MKGGFTITHTQSTVPLVAPAARYASLFSASLGFHVDVGATDVPAETVKVPQMAESISEGTLKSWLKQPGEFVSADEEVATIETDKVRNHTHACALRRWCSHRAQRYLCVSRRLTSL